MPNPVDVIKQAAMEAQESSKPVNILFGTVLSASPLKIQVDQKSIYTSKMLILTRNVTDFEVDMTVNHSTEDKGGGSGAAAYAALLDLVTDICKRNGIKKLVWSTNKNDRVNHRNGCNMTVHRDFANKACPGEYLYSRHGEIAAEVNRRLQGASNGGGVVVTPPAAEKPTGGTTGATVTPYLVRVKITNLNIRKGPGTNYGATGYIQPGIYTIVAESTGKGAAKWGKLKSGAGWISLDYATKT